MMRRYFAIVPAAGMSARMGRAKLLLPLAGMPLFEQTMEAWRQSGVDLIVVRVRADDAALRDFIQATVKSKIGAPAKPVHPRSAIEAEGSRLEMVLPEAAPPDMKASVQAALGHLQRQ